MRQALETAHDLKQKVEELLEPALPVLVNSVQQLNMLRKCDICEVNSLGSPPSLVLLTLQALCIMFDIRPVKRMSPLQPGRKIDDYWEVSRRSLLSDGHLIHKMLEFDKDTIPERTIQKLRPILEDENFSPERVRKVSILCSAICTWIQSMVTYHQVAVRARPSRKCLADKQAEIDQLVYHQKVIESVRSDLLLQVKNGGNT